MTASALFHLRRPSRLLGTTVDETFSYEHVGATAGEPPAGWNCDRYVGDIGTGSQWPRVRQAVDDMVMFDLAWTHLVHHDPLAEGGAIIYAARMFGLWVLNACRVVYVVDEEDETSARYGFAFGTLGNHALRGEERFLATWDKQTDIVRFELFKFSLPGHPLVRLFHPVAIRLAERFNRDVIRRVRAEIEGG